MTDRQAEIASGLREIAKTPDTEDAWGPFVDFTQAMATMIEGVESMATPKEMEKRFSRAWAAAAKVFVVSHQRIVRDCLGGQPELDRVINHPDARNIMARIVDRVREVHGELTPGMTVDDVDVADILDEYA